MTVSLKGQRRSKTAAMVGLIITISPTWSFASGNAVKSRWIDGCMTVVEGNFKNSYENNKNFKVMQDFEYGKGEFLKGGIVKEARSFCERNIEVGLIKMAGRKTWKELPDTAAEGCYYASWLGMEEANDDDGHLKDENLRTPFYLKDCKSSPDDQWRKKWHKIRIDFLVRTAQRR